MRRWMLCLPALLLIGACAGEGDEQLRAEDRDAYQRLLLQHARRYPASRAEDYYKLISQSVFGIAHLIDDAASAREYLDREMLTLGPPHPDESLLEPLDPEGTVVRVHLRPFAAQGLSRDSLVTVMMETARTVRGDTTVFLGRWRAFRDLIKENRVPVPMGDYEAVDEYARERRYPALHHSDDYRGAYKPAYRVVRKDLFLKKVPGPYRGR